MDALEDLLKSEFQNKLQKLKNKYPPISELINGKLEILKIKNIYKINEEYKNFFLIKARNYLKKPKLRYFVAINLASQSSDLLVSLVDDLIKIDSSLKLIQFSIYPKSSRVNLLALKELTSVDSVSITMGLLKRLRKDFRKRLVNLKNLL